MKATGFSGVAHVMGRDRQIRFEGETLQVAGLSLEEATQVVTLLERLQLDAGRTQIQPPPTRRVESPAPAQKVETKPEQKVEQKVETKPETKPKVETKPETKKVETKPETKKPETKPKVETKPETKPETRRVVAPEPTDAPDEGDDIDFDPETGEVRSTPEEIEQEAREEREAIQAADEEEEAPPPKSKTNGKTNGAVAADDDIPDDVKKARHLRSVIGYLVETKGFEDADAIVAWCKANADAIPTVKRIGDKLEDRVTRALQIMSN